MSLPFNASLTFEVPDDTNADELAEILSYIKIAIDKWRYSAGLKAPWKISNIDVPSFRIGLPEGHPFDSSLLRAPLVMKVDVPASGSVGCRPMFSVGNGSAISPPARKKISVIVQKWEESERSWGVRPDGYSIHPSEDALFRYIEAYKAKLPSEVPHEYERPCGEPCWAEVEVPADMDMGDGKRVYRHQTNEYPVLAWNPVRR